MGTGAAVWGENAVLFGGANGQQQNNDLFLFNPSLHTWTKVERGEAPLARTGASLAVLGNTLFVFGGLSNEVGWLDDFHSLDLSNEQSSWQIVDVPCPYARDKAGLASYGGALWLFGGFGPLVSC